jgi:hypothetical protein
MALRGPIAVRFEQVFPMGAYLASEVTPVHEFENGAKGKQKVHPVTGDPMWEITVIDADPEVKASQKAVKVKLSSKYQPVPPNATPGQPFTAVEFTEMAVTPYLTEGAFGRSQITYSIQAREMQPATPVPAL